MVNNDPVSVVLVIQIVLQEDGKLQNEMPWKTSKHFMQIHRLASFIMLNNDMR
jgi:hypothetical protein